MSQPQPVFDDAPFRLPDQLTETELIAKYFRGLGNPTRLRILELVGEKERSVGELAAIVGEAQPKISNHLACLRWCGYVTTRRDHRTIYYRQADQRVATMVALAHDLLHENADHIAACCVIPEADGK